MMPERTGRFGACAVRTAAHNRTAGTPQPALQATLNILSINVGHLALTSYEIPLWLLRRSAQARSVTVACRLVDIRAPRAQSILLVADTSLAIQAILPLEAAFEGELPSDARRSERSASLVGSQLGPTVPRCEYSWARMPPTRKWC